MLVYLRLGRQDVIGDFQVWQSCDGRRQVIFGKTLALDQRVFQRVRFEMNENNCTVL